MDYIRETKDWLKNYNNMKNSIDNMKMQIEELEELIDGIGTINYSGMPTGNYNIPDDRIANNIFTRDRIKENLIKTEEAIKKFEEIINKLKEDEKEVIRMTYFYDKTDIDIQNMFNISRTTLMRLRAKAIRSIGISLFGIMAM